MKPRLKIPSSSPRGYTVRLAEADIAHLLNLSEVISNGTVNRLLVIMVLEIVYLCQSSPFSFPANSALTKLLSHPTYKTMWQQLAQEDLRRTLPNSASRLIKLTFPVLERQRLGNLSRQLEWAVGQVILSALQAFCVFAGSDKPIEDLPAIILLSRGGRLLMGGSAPESADDLRNYLNVELGLIPRPRVEQPDPETPTGFTTELDLI